MAACKLMPMLRGVAGPISGCGDTRGSLSRARVFLATVAAALVGLAPAARACPYSIRDAGFIVRDPTPYRLYVFTDDSSAASGLLPQWLDAVASEHLRGSNVEAEVVNIEQHKDHVATAHLRAVKAPALPAAVLVSMSDEALLLPGLGPGAVSEQAVQTVVREVVASPVRERIVDDIVRDWCVVVVAAGARAAENQRAARAARAAAEGIVGTITDMGVKVERAPAVISVAQDDEAEKVLLWSLGLRDGDHEQARAAVLFGRARRVGPVLEGAALTERALREFFWMLGRNCTCTTDPSWLLGPAAPLQWGQDLRTRVRLGLGFDPDDPAAGSALAGVWTMFDTAASQTDPSFDYGGGYMEFPVDPDQGDAETQFDRVTAVPPTSPALKERVGRTLLVAIAALALLVFGSGVVLVLRARRQR